MMTMNTRVEVPAWHSGEEDFGSCPYSDDGIHCEHWWDGEACCLCGAPAVMEDKRE